MFVYVYDRTVLLNAPVNDPQLSMSSQNIDHSSNLITFGQVYSNPSVLPKSPSPGSLLVNVSKAGRNVCQASKEDSKTCGGEYMYFHYFLPLAYYLEGKIIKKRELRVGMGGFKHGGRYVMLIR